MTEMRSLNNLYCFKCGGDKADGESLIVMIGDWGAGSARKTTSGHNPPVSQWLFKVVLG